MNWGVVIILALVALNVAAPLILYKARGRWARRMDDRA